MRFAHTHIQYTIIHLNNTTSHKPIITNNNGKKHFMKFMETSKHEMCNLCIFPYLTDKKR